MTNVCALFKILAAVYHGETVEKGRAQKNPPRNETALTNGFGKLEHKTESDLDNAIRQRNFAVISKSSGRVSGRPDINARQVTTSGDTESRLRMIQHVESFPTQLQLDVLKKPDGLEEAHVELIERGTTQIVAWRITKRCTEDSSSTRAVENESHGAGRRRDALTGAVDLVKRVEAVDVG